MLTDDNSSKVVESIEHGKWGAFIPKHYEIVNNSILLSIIRAMLLLRIHMINNMDNKSNFLLRLLLIFIKGK